MHKVRRAQGKNEHIEKYVRNGKGRVYRKEECDEYVHAERMREGMKSMGNRRDIFRKE